MIASLNDAGEIVMTKWMYTSANSTEAIIDVTIPHISPDAQIKMAVNDLLDLKLTVATYDSVKNESRLYVYNNKDLKAGFSLDDNIGPFKELH